MVNENRFLIKTREKAMHEVDEFYDWLNENFITVSYAGGRSYWVEGEGDATMVKLFWGDES